MVPITTLCAGLGLTHFIASRGSQAHWQGPFLLALAHTLLLSGTVIFMSGFVPLLHTELENLFSTDEMAFWLMALALLCFAASFSNLVYSVFRGSSLRRIGNFFLFLATAVIPLVAIAAIHSQGLRNCLIYSAIGSIIVSAVGLVSFSNLLEEPLKKWSWSSARDVFYFGWSRVPSIGINSVLLIAPVLALAERAPAATVGIYNVLFMLGSIGVILFEPIGRVLFSVSANLQFSGQAARLARGARLMLAKSAVLSAALAISTGLLAPFGTSLLLGVPTSFSSNTLVLLGIGVFGMSLNELFRNILDGVDRRPLNLPIGIVSVLTFYIALHHSPANPDSVVLAWALARCIQGLVCVGAVWRRFRAT
jgi:O-antigen/teichoic acid export membrane protein